MIHEHQELIQGNEGNRKITIFIGVPHFWEVSGGFGKSK